MEAQQLPGPGSDGLLGTAVGEIGHCFKGNVSSPNCLGSDGRWGWVRVRTQRSPFSRALLSLTALASLSRSPACLASPLLSIRSLSSELSVSQQAAQSSYWGKLLCVGNQPLGVSDP